MRWFKHLTNASDDVKLKRLEEEFGNDGYAGFFKLLEKIGQEGSKCRLRLSKYPVEVLAKDFNIEKNKFAKILERMAELDLISKGEYKKDIIAVLNLRKYADEYTSRGQEYYKQRKLSRYSNEDYRKVEQVYINLKNIKPQGEEWLPIKRTIKSMFLSKRTPDEIISCIKWLAGNDFYKNKWTIHTVAKKLPEFLSGELEEEVKIPTYAHKRK